MCAIALVEKLMLKGFNSVEEGILFLAFQKENNRVGAIQDKNLGTKAGEQKPASLPVDFLAMSLKLFLENQGQK
ncbi:MAG: hypothetical protein EOO62_00285 [Hymenobacter sp.]|nr:MAG: hypothetical protein EOO62_00285 [Hymenobacter sp.]